MTTKSMNVSLPENLYKFVTERVSSDSHGTVSTYVRSLIIADLKLSEQERLDRLILESLNSGESIEVTDGWSEKMKARVRERVTSMGKSHK